MFTFQFLHTSELCWKCKTSNCTATRVTCDQALLSFLNENEKEQQLTGNLLLKQLGIIGFIKYGLMTSQ